MKNLVYLFLLFGLAFFNACKSDEVNSATEYLVHINSPAANTVKKVGEDLPVKVTFEEQNGGTVHHINVRIFNKVTNAEVYNKPAEAHVHTAASYTFEDNVTLHVAAGDYVLEAKVWGHDDGVAETIEKVAFKVEPQ